MTPGSYVRGRETYRGMGPDPKYIGPYQRVSRQWFRYVRKDGSLGAPHELSLGWYTELQQCEACGRWGSPKKIHDRCDAYCFELGQFRVRLCGPCSATRIRRAKQWRELQELRSTARLLARTRPE